MAAGLHGAKKVEFEDLIYVWKVLSYKIGIDSKYNLFEDVNFDMVYAICKLVLEQEYILHMVSKSSIRDISCHFKMLIKFNNLGKRRSSNWNPNERRDTFYFQRYISWFKL